jgi:hypothetical protein
MVHWILIEAYLDTHHQELLNEAQKRRLLKEVSGANPSGSRFRNALNFRVGRARSLWRNNAAGEIFRLRGFIKTAISRRQPCETC